MRVGLFIPCYIDQFYPSAAIATLSLLEKYGHEVVYPSEQTCCGQPMANAGCACLGKDVDDLFLKNFKDCDAIVSPSGSCTLHVREHIIKGHKEYPSIYELCEFLVDVIKVSDIEAKFPFVVGLHESCHGLRGLRLGKASELMEPEYSKPRYLLEKVNGIRLASLQRPDECCGFGGTFAVSEEAVSVRMGEDRIEDHINSGVEVITATDLSCLMHLEGLLKRRKSTVRVMHIAEILNSR